MPNRPWPLRSLLLTLLAMGGCAQPAGILFPPPAKPVVFPDPPEPTRIAWVGQLSTSADLKAAKSGMEAFGELILGKKETYSMLSPFSMCTDGADRLFVADTGAQLVHVFDLRTRQYARWTPAGDERQQRKRKTPGLRFTQPVGVAWDPAGRLIVSDSLAGVLFIFDPQGNLLGQLGAGILQRPAGVVVDPRTRRILVADVMAHQVIVLTPEGQLEKRIGQRGPDLGQFNFPTNLALDGMGRLYVSDSLNFRIQQFAPDLTPLRQIGTLGDVAGTFSQPKGVAVDSENHLYVVDSRFENVQIFDAEGRLLLAFGEEGTGPGQFWLPAGIFIDPRNRVWIADTYNRRVSVFDYLTVAEPQAQTRPATLPATRPQQETKP